MSILQLATLVFILIYYGILLGFRAYLLYRRTGVNAIKNIPKDELGRFNENVLLFCFVLISVIGFNFVFIPQNYFLMGPIDYLTMPILANIGMVMGAFGLIFAFVAQLQMGDSWRLGYQDQGEVNLIRHGLYKYSRNPVYVGILVAILGYFFMLPSAASLLLLGLMFTSIQIKVRMEEVYLERQFSKSYLNYKNDVGRWL